jgi:hypothetical protein
MVYRRTKPCATCGIAFIFPRQRSTLCPVCAKPATKLLRNKQQLARRRIQHLNRLRTSTDPILMLKGVFTSVDIPDGLNERVAKFVLSQSESKQVSAIDYDSLMTPDIYCFDVTFAYFVLILCIYIFVMFNTRTVDHIKR